MKNRIPFTVTVKMKYLGLNLTKQVYNLYAKNYTTVLKEIKEKLNKWRYIPSSWIGRLNLVKMSISPKLICRFNSIPIKYQQDFFLDVDKIILMFIWTVQEAQDGGDTHTHTHTHTHPNTLAT